ncbi:MAG TPA: discoidin domain-containing protein [Verrucomicrobiota bacterium]|nr:discoidin domain-containing protein [Verrucomicrobiota bacterium]
MNMHSRILGLTLLAGLAAISANATSLTNWARIGTATQSSTLNNAMNPTAAKAIDGNRSGSWGDASMSHTATGNAGEWWQVDLGEARPIGHVHLWFREDCCPERNEYLRVVIYDRADLATRVPLWETNTWAWAGTTPRDLGFNLDPVVDGRVVVVDHLEGLPEYVSLAEVEVFDQPLVALMNYAQDINGGTAASSSVYAGDPSLYGPQQAIDGNHMGLTSLSTGAYLWGYSAPDDTPDADPLPWWRVDLPAPQTIGSVVLWPRRDRTYARYDQVQLTVADAGANPLYAQVFAVQPSGPKFVINFAPPLAQGQSVVLNTTADTPDTFLNLPEVEVFPPLPAAPAMAFVTNLPAAIEVVEGNAVTLGPVLATVDGGIRPEEISYRWYRNGTEVAGAAGSWMNAYTTPLLGQADGGARYKVQASVSGHGVFSSETTLTVTADVVAPTLVTNSFEVTDSVRMFLVFSERLDPASAGETAHYALEGGPTTDDAVLQADGRTVMLTIGNLLLGDNISLLISGVKDPFNNTIVPVAIQAASPSTPINYARTGVATQSSLYPHSIQPVASKAIDGNTTGSWSAGTIACTAGAGDYGWWEVDLRTPRNVGQVIVWWRTDCCFTRNRNVDLVLYDSADPGARTELLRVAVSGEVNPPNPTILDLGAGTIAQVVHLEHTLATDLADPGNTQLCLAEVQVMPAATGLQITASPVSWNVRAGDRVFLRADVQGTAPIACRWQRNGEDVPGATALELVLADITPAQAGTYTLVASNPLRVRTSVPATVAVTPRPSLADSLVLRYQFADAPAEDNVIVDDAPANPAKTQAHHAENRGATWEAEVADAHSVARQGVIHFDGTLRDQQMAVVAHPDLDSRVGTLCFWMKGLPANTIGYSGATLFDRRTAFVAGSVGDSLSIAPPDRDPAIYADHEPGCLFNQSTSTGISIDGVTRLDDDAWHHVAYVYAMDSIGIIAFYVDGKLENEKTDGYAGFWPASQPLEFGRSTDTWPMAYSGYLDDIHVFNRVLNEAELAQVMKGLPPAVGVTVAEGLLRFSWSGSGYILQQNASVTHAAGWADVSGADQSPVLLPLPGTGMQFYRLRQQ